MDFTFIYEVFSILSIVLHLSLYSIYYEMNLIPFTIIL